MLSDIHQMQDIFNNNLYIMREDLIPFSFGGNKARKAKYFFKDILKNNYNYVITYGSASSNHCRIISNLCAKYDIKCTIISTDRESNSYNRNLCKIFNVEIISCNVDEVKEIISKQMNEKSILGYKTYFIQGGGHGNIGTQAYIDAYKEIELYENEHNFKFDYIFHASGTGTTQAGLVIGNRLNNSSTKIVGISIARKSPYGKNVIIDSVQKYCNSYNLELKNIDKEINFIDDYVLQGYGNYNKQILETIKEVLIKEGIPLDTTYTGKAFWGMKEYIKKEKIKNKKLLFIHTGGTPIFFDKVKEI